MREYDVAAGLTVVAAGAFFFWGAGRIEIYGGDAIPADFFPKVVSSLIVVAGIILTVAGVRRRSVSAEVASENDVTDNDWSDFLRVTLPLVALTVCYILAWRSFGYVLATLMVAPSMFFVFGNRGFTWAFLVPVGTALAFFFIFFSGMGLHDAPGQFFDQTPINRMLGS